jgi:hypothetical protein
MSAFDTIREIAAAVHDAGAAAVQTARSISDSPHMGAIHAWIRQGADEIAQALPAFPDSNIRPQSELGQIFEVTQSQANEQIRGREPEMDLDR